MSIFRRPTRAAGHSWRKWEDPIVYRTPLSLKLGHLAFWLLLGVSAAFLVILFSIADPATPTINVPFLLADIATVALAWVAVLGLLMTWNEMQEYAG